MINIGLSVTTSILGWLGRFCIRKFMPRVDLSMEWTAWNHGLENILISNPNKLQPSRIYFFAKVRSYGFFVKVRSKNIINNCESVGITIVDSI